MFKLPFVKKSELKKLNKEYEQYKNISEQEIRNKNYQINNLKENLKTANKAINEVLPKLIQIVVEPNGDDFDTYKLILYFSRRMIYDSMIHGNSKDMIQYLAKQMGYQVERELNTINFARVDYRGR